VHHEEDNQATTTTTDCGAAWMSYSARMDINYSCKTPTIFILRQLKSVFERESDVTRRVVLCRKLSWVKFRGTKF